MEIRSSSRAIFLLKLFCFSLCFLCSVFSAEALQKEAHQKTVVIDAGHGGKDPGTVVGKAKEKNVVLDIALKLGKLIRQYQGNIKVVFIRDGDYFVPLMDRANIANKVNADLFISIHANYCDNPEINGTETYVLGLHRTEGRGGDDWRCAVGASALPLSPRLQRLELPEDRAGRGELHSAGRGVAGGVVAPGWGAARASYRQPLGGLPQPRGR